MALDVDVNSDLLELNINDQCAPRAARALPVARRPILLAPIELPAPRAGCAEAVTSTLAAARRDRGGG